MGKFLPGNKASKGRQKGSQNKFTNLKDAFLNALQNVGGQAYIEDFARKYPREFLAIVAKLLPTKVNLGDANGEPITITIRGYDGNKPSDTSAS